MVDDTAGGCVHAPAYLVTLTVRAASVGAAQQVEGLSCLSLRHACMGKESV